MANYPSYTRTPRVGTSSISTANTNRDGSGTVALLGTGRNSLHLNYASTSALIAGQGSQVALRFYYVVNAAAVNGGDVYQWTGMTAGTIADYRKLADDEALEVLSAKGSRVKKITIKATGTTTAGMVRLFHYDGSVYKLLDEVVVSAITVGAGVASFKGSIPFTDGFNLPNGESFYVSTHNAEGFVVLMEIEEY